MVARTGWLEEVVDRLGRESRGLAVRCSSHPLASASRKGVAMNKFRGQLNIHSFHGLKLTPRCSLSCSCAYLQPNSAVSRPSSVRWCQFATSARLLRTKLGLARNRTKDFMPPPRVLVHTGKAGPIKRLRCVAALRNQFERSGIGRPTFFLKSRVSSRALLLVRYCGQRRRDTFIQTACGIGRIAVSCQPPHS